MNRNSVAAFALLSLLCVFDALPAHAQIQVRQRYMGIFEMTDLVESKGTDSATGAPSRPYRRRTLDMKELEAELEFQINPESKFEFEVDYEHGGTGSAVEYEQDEEFGEFERETEKGGEVEIEEAYYQRKLSSSTDLIVGKAPLYISLSSIMDSSPLLYSSTQTSHLEKNIIPYKWRETGVQLNQRLGDFTLRFGAVSGLNSETFNSQTWIGNGRQKMFEKQNLDDIAVLGSAEWGDVAQGRGIGFTYYTAETTNNRYKKDRYTKPGNINLWSMMGQWNFGPIGVTGELIRGSLKNSSDIANANNNYPNADPIKQANADIGSKAFLDLLQLRYDITDSWTVFAQWEHVNTFQDVEGTVISNPRLDVHHAGGGVAHKWDDICFLKFQYYTEKTHLESLAASNVYILQFGFDTGEF